MVVKTELCAFSEYRIYPGHGQKFIRKDGQPINLLTSKAKSLNNQRKKPALLMWTTAWRRLNKKGSTEGTLKKKARRAVKIQRAIVGASLEDLHKKRTAPRAPANVATQAALKEVKARGAAKGAAKGAQGAGGKGNVVPKIQRSNANTRGGVSR